MAALAIPPSDAHGVDLAQGMSVMSMWAADTCQLLVRTESVLHQLQAQRAAADPYLAQPLTAVTMLMHRRTMRC